MEWKNAIIDFEFYLKIERGLSENTVKNYSLDIEALTKFIIENNIYSTTSNLLQDFIANTRFVLASIIHDPCVW